MSKVDAQRAMRDARYAAYEARRKAEGDPVGPAPTPKKPEIRPAVTPAKPDASEPAADASEPAATEPAGTEKLCGHRSIGNKSCIRPAGHAQASHRYK